MHRGEGQSMANQWALLIGINQYKALQPLMYAQSDAVELRNFFVDELGVPVNNCTLLTDLSAAIEPHAYAPLRKEVEGQLRSLCREKVQPGDLLWVFFSGCGLTEAGQDYWMTLDSEPMKPSETAIALTDVFAILSQARTDQILLVMDMNRSQGAVGHRQIGSQTLTLANDSGIATFLSCQPEEYSHETMYVRHGLFTKALLEGLRYHGCITVSQLSIYLSDRVPELCEHHCRPQQNPAMVIPSAQKFMMVVPPEGIANLSVTEQAKADLEAGRMSTVPASKEAVTTPSTAPMPPAPPSTFTSSTTDAATTAGKTSQPSLPFNQKTSSTATTQADRGGAIVHKPDAANREEDEDEGIPADIWKWGILAAVLAFLAGVFLRYQPTFLSNLDWRNDTDSSETVIEPAEENSETAAAPANTEGDQLFSEEVDPIEAGETALQKAQEAIAANRYGEARAWLTQVPPELQDNQYQSLLEQANSEVAEAAVRNQSILETARTIIQPTSASMFNDAIEQARQVPPEDPYYEQAQADIARWSQVILDLAEGRAATGDIGGAIAAARLVPEDQAGITELAQQRITAWEQQITNQELIRQTQNSLQPGQASSFNDAIRALEQIMPDQPGYATAQERIEQWSNDILAIARARAAQGDLGGAIAAAELVPENTSAYEQARQEIQRWQEQL